MTVKIKKSYPQLDEQTHALLIQQLDRLAGNKAALARELGVTRPVISMALARKYPAGVRRLRTRIWERYASSIRCPHLGRDIAPSECRTHRERPRSAASREALQH